MNKIFKLLNTSKDCYNYLFKIIKNKKNEISEESRKLIIIFSVKDKDIITDKEEKVKIVLNPKILDINKSVDNYIIALKELKKESIDLKNEISTLKI